MVGVVVSFSALAGGTPATNGAATGVQKLLTPAGAATTLDNGEYVTNTAGLNSSYRFWIEVPQGTPRLRVELFDPDTSALNDTGTSVFQYVVLDPAGTQRATILSSATDPAASGNAWFTLFDTSAAYVLDRFSTAAYTNDDGPLPWAAAWAEENGDGSPTTGRITIAGGVLRINPQNTTNLAIARSADLSGLASATLSFTAAGAGLDGNERIAVEYSTNGGGAWTTLESLYPGNATVTRSYSVTPSATSRVRFRRAGSDWANNANEYVTFDDVRIQGPTAAPAAGHWEVRMLGTSGDGANGVGLRANDGDATSAGVELNVYYRSYFNYGTTSGARTFVDHPWVTAGCAFTSNDFDGDSNGSITFSSRTGAFTSAAVAVSGNNAWNSGSVTGWTTAADATDYGTWTTTFVVPNDLNCITTYLGAFHAAAAPPTAQPEANTLRVYLPTDAGARPAKPYAEQQVRHMLGAGPNPVAVGQTSRFTVTVRVVNPTAWPVTFSNAAANVVTVNVPGGGTVYGGNAQVSQGTVVTQPAVGATGNVTWDPGVLAAGATALLAYEVRVTPAAAGTIAVTGSPTSNGTTALYLDETANATQTAQTRITLGPLCRLSLATDTPTLALLDEARASEATAGVLLEWTTASEAGTAGFEVWRVAEGLRERVLDEPLEASLSPAGGRYRLLDRDARPGIPAAYEIVEIESDGGRRSHGVVTYEPGAGAAAEEEIPEAGYEAKPRRAAVAAPGSESLVTELRSLGPGANAATGTPPSGLRIETSGEGMTLVPFADAAAKLGVTPQAMASAAQSGKIALRRHDGAAIAWTATPEGILFWAERFESLYARGAVYQLTLDRGSRMATQGVRGLAVRPVESYREKRHVEQDLVDAVALPLDPSADYWLWKGFIAGRSGLDRATFPVTVEGLAPGAAQLTVGLQGSSAASFGSHHVRVLVNGTLAGEAVFSGYERLDAPFDLPEGVVLEGSNSIALEFVRDAGTAQSIVYLDAFDLDYPRRYDALGAAPFVFEAPAGSPVDVVGLPAGSAALYDVTVPTAPKVLTGFSSRSGQVRFSTQGLDGRYAVVVGGAAARPWALDGMDATDLRSTLRAGADYLVVTSAALRTEAAALASLRQKQGLTAAVVTFEAVSDQFAGGVRSPLALRAFLEHAFSTWATKPRYLVLAGAGTYDYRDLRGYGANHVPALLRSSSGGLFPADRDYATTQAGVRLPIAVGRIPARTPAELQAAVEKIAAYEGGTASTAWIGRAVFLSDDAEGGADFALASEAAASRLRLPMTKETLRLGPLPADTVRSTLLARFAEGFGLLAYFGHAGLDRIAAEQLLTSADVAALPATEGTPIVVALTCVLNRFGVPGYTSLGETLANRAGAGASAVLSSSALSDNGSALAFAQRVIGALSPTSPTRLGDVVAAAAGTDDDGAVQTLAFYNLLGDPALLVRRPATTPGGNQGTGRNR